MNGTPGRWDTGCTFPVKLTPLLLDFTAASPPPRRQAMARWLKDYLSFGNRRVPPQPPKPDYSESEILRAYRAQRNLDFEDPYEEGEHHQNQKPASPDIKYVSPKHRLIKVDSTELGGRAKILGGEETKGKGDIVSSRS